LWLANGSASGKAQKVFCYYVCYLKPPDRPGLVISSQSLVLAAYCRADSFFRESECFGQIVSLPLAHLGASSGKAPKDFHPRRVERLSVRNARTMRRPVG
jgi:hypothetical protein